MKEFKSPWVKVSVAKLAPLKNVKRLGVTIERGGREGPRS
jgi:7,8-dihydroneopterin aldolase/epimerase/oxygenase